MGVQKYVATVFFLTALFLTYKMSQSTGGLTLQARQEIELSLEDSITAYIKAQRPDVTDVVFQQLYSESLGESVNELGQTVSSMKINFRYLTEEGTKDNAEQTEQTFEGNVTLKSTDKETWEWVDNSVQSPLIRFRKGTEIRLNEPSTSL